MININEIELGNIVYHILRPSTKMVVTRIVKRSAYGLNDEDLIHCSYFEPISGQHKNEIFRPVELCRIQSTLHEPFENMINKRS